MNIEDQIVQLLSEAGFCLVVYDGLGVPPDGTKEEASATFYEPYNDEPFCVEEFRGNTREKMKQIVRLLVQNNKEPGFEVICEGPYSPADGPYPIPE